MEKGFYLFDKGIAYKNFLHSDLSKKDLGQKFVKEIKSRYNITTDKIKGGELNYNEVGKDLCEYYTDSQGRQHDGYFILDNITGLGKEDK